MGSIELETLQSEIEQLKADKASLTRLLVIVHTELDAALLKIDCDRDLIKRLRGISADWMARALKAEGERGARHADSTPLRRRADSASSGRRSR